MTDNLTELYQEIILEHHKRPKNYRFLEGHSHQAKGQNPRCGDSVEVFLRVVNGRIEEATFQGQGCAISQASASILTEAIIGASVDQASACAQRALELIRVDGRVADLELDGDLAALSGVRKFPARMKCAGLAWHALQSALENKS